MYSLINAAYIPDKYHFTYSVLLLVAARLGTVFYPTSVGAWASSAFIHVVEAVFFGSLIFAVAPMGGQFQAGNLQPLQYQGLFLFAIVIADAVLFSLRFYELEARKKKND